MTTLQQFNTTSSTTSTIASSGAVFGSVINAVGTASSLGGAISSGLSSGDIASAIRSINIPAAGAAVGSIVSAVSSFANSDNPNDFRVRLSLPLWPSFINSPVLKPLHDAGGMIFPYTPNIQIRSVANYGHESVMHSNFSVNYFKNSEPQTITISAPMNVEDQTQALYWIGAFHYFRSVTKMFMGVDPLAGNPPPLVFLNGYGNYVFKNIPVVVESVDIEFSNDCDYISTPVVASAAAQAASVANAVGSVANTVGSAIPALAGLTGAINSIAGAASSVSAILGAYNVGGTTSGGLAYVPTKSEFRITVRPVYSRTSMRQFSLDLFVTGGYINNYFGYV